MGEKPLVCDALCDTRSLRQLHRALPFLDKYDDEYTLELKAARARASQSAHESRENGNRRHDQAPNCLSETQTSLLSPPTMGPEANAYARTREAMKLVKELLRKASAGGAGGEGARLSVREIGDAALRLQRVQETKATGSGSEGAMNLARLEDALAAHLALALPGTPESEALPAMHALAVLFAQQDGIKRAHRETQFGPGISALSVAAARWLGDEGTAGSHSAAALGVEVPRHSRWCWVQFFCLDRASSLTACSRADRERLRASVRRCGERGTVG